MTHELLRRRSVLGAVAGGGALATLAACSQESGEPAAAQPSAADGTTTTLRVALGWIKNVEWAGLWRADDAGYYAEEGLSIEWLQGGPNAPTVMASVAADSADLGIAAGQQSLLQSIPQGNDFVVVGSIFQDAPGSLLSLASRPVRSAADLKGQKVLGQEGTQPTIDALFRLAGMEPDYEFVTAAYDPGPLVEGQGVAYTCYLTNQPIILEQSYGLAESDYVVTPYSAMGIPQYASLIFGQRAFLDGNRDTVVKFLRASVRGWADNEEDPEVAAKLAVEKYGVDLGLDLEQQVQENELQIPLTESDLTRSAGMFRMDPALMAGEMYDALRAAQVTDLPDADSIIDMTLLDEVYANGTTL
ncbi:ABC transporter substrate-binding protein [Kineococcus rhizosphaerae]|uniref:Thiamine pyrimidine synthase n=1 Tax=Kineococcus rhizosphaerae TaxID=559628 RepID=A0A2T0QXF3_9ACTN|nr:ABC transporter substrate-binding protein [Kineococcus rhizosphaerae]PRY10497.1 ABC-type nitrate/sulfonate/bicarbonate transport system substrate-binding protein [Kineococcus rhizosphaerae]